jgi:hypothetical protein
VTSDLRRTPTHIVYVSRLKGPTSLACGAAQRRQTIGAMS